MPKQIRAISDDMLRSNGVYDLDPATPLVAAQCGLLLSRSKTRLDSDRRDGKPPPFYKDGSKVLYRLGDVLALRQELQDDMVTDHQRGKAPKTFSAFMAFGASNDMWPCALVNGRPIDFFASLGMMPDSAEWMTLGEILVGVKDKAREVQAIDERQRLQEALGERKTQSKRRIF